jgi:transcriptional regulator with XRE-family HTH domain
VKKMLGTVLRRVREEAGVSQRDLARLTGMAVGQISMLETSGRVNPGFMTIARLAKALRVSMDALATECAWGGETLAASSLVASDRERLALLREIETAKTDAQRVVDRLESLTESKSVRRKRKA